MIIDNLYPLNDTIDVGYPNADKEVELTSQFGVDPVLSMDAYWLGYITHDTLPMQYCCAMVYQEEDTEDVIIKEITDKVNFPCGYLYDYYDRTQQYRITIYQNADGTETYPNLAYRYLFNTNFPEYSGLMYLQNRSESCLMNAYCYIYNQGDQLVYPYDDSSNYAYITIFQSTGIYYIDEIYKFLFLGEHYDATIDIIEGGETKTLHFDITADLFEDGTAYVPDTTGNYSARLYLAGFYFGEGAGMAGLQTITFPASFTVKTSETYNEYHNEHIETGSGYHEYTDRLWYARYDIPTISDPQFVYGVKTDIRIPKNAFSNITTVGTYLFQDGVLIHKNDGRKYISGINTIDDIRKSFSLYYRVCRENVDSYVAGKTYATDVTPSNEFLARLKTGDIQDNTFKNSLRPWQYGNFDEDEFTEDDIPSEDPGPDGDWDPDTQPDEDPNDYEKKPTSQTHPPLFASLGPRYWIMSIDEFRGIYLSVKNIMSQLILYYNDLSQNLPASLITTFSGLSTSEETQLKLYSGFAGNNILDAIGSIIWYPFDLTRFFQTTTNKFAWGLTTQTELATDYIPGDTVNPPIPPTTIETFAKEITGYWYSGYLLEGGTCTYFKHYDSFIDYAPYCDAVLYIPYCGSVHIDPQRFVGHELKLKYLVDFLSGACLALVYRDDLIVDTLPGQMGINIPVSMENFSSYISQVQSANNAMNSAKIGLIGSAVSATTATAKATKDIAIAGMGAGVAGGGAAFGHNVPGLVGAGLGVAESLNQLNSAQYALDSAHMTMQTISAGSSALASGNEQVARLVLYQPRWLDGYKNKEYGEYGHTTGFATVENKKLKNFTGFTIAENVDTSGIGQATEKEKAMIQKAFKGGVYMPN